MLIATEHENVVQNENDVFCLQNLCQLKFHALFSIVHVQSMILTLAFKTAASVMVSTLSRTPHHIGIHYTTTHERISSHAVNWSNRNILINKSHVLIRILVIN